MYKPPNRKMPRGSINLIAAAAGVRQSYISAVLHGRTEVTPEQSARLAAATRQVFPTVTIGDADWMTLGAETGCWLFARYRQYRRRLTCCTS
jgi:DNA-binding transcriptional regulator YdaS (Cro superfamily)